MLLDNSSFFDLGDETENPRLSHEVCTLGPVLIQPFEHQKDSLAPSTTARLQNTNHNSQHNKPSIIVGACAELRECETNPIVVHAQEKQKRRATPWTSEEHQRFLRGLERLRTEHTEAVGENGNMSCGLGPGIAEVIALIVGTRSPVQVRSHAQKHFQRQRREA